MHTEDDQLISSYLEGDDQSLAVLVDRYLPHVYNFAFSLTRDKSLAEDVTQESFVKAWKNIRKFSPTKSFRGWLFTIARNTAIDVLRKKKDIPFSSFETENGNTLVDTLKDSEPTPAELVTLAEDYRYLENMLQELNPMYREVLTLRHTSDMTFDEIAQIVSRPLHTVKSQYRRAIIALRRLNQERLA